MIQNADKKIKIPIDIRQPLYFAACFNDKECATILFEHYEKTREELIQNEN